MDEAYQSAKRRVNAGGLFLALLCWAGTLWPGNPQAQTSERVEYTTADAVRISADYLSPLVPGRAAIILFHREGSERAEFGGLPGALAAAGFQVLVPDLRGHGLSESGERPGRSTEAAPAMRDGTAAIAYLQSRIGPDVEVGLVGIGLGALVAAGASGTLAAGPSALVLFDPESRLAGASILQPSAPPTLRCLLATGRDDVRSRAAARTLFLMRPRQNHLWLLDGGAHIVDRLLQRPDFAGDVAAWMKRMASSKAG